MSWIRALIGKRGSPESESAASALRIPDYLPAALVALAYLLASLRLTDFRRVFEIDPDEGNNLVKALLLDRGHGFLSEIWSDQPPLFAYALWGLFELFGWKIRVAREVVLVLSAALVFALYDSVRIAATRRHGVFAAHLGALASVLLLAFASGFAVLRVSVMIGLPAIALAALAVWLALVAGGFARELGARERRFWLAGAGAVLGLSLATKLFTAFLVPAVLAAAVFPELARLRSGGLRAALVPAAWFVLGFAVALVLGLSPALFSGALSELYLAHAEASTREYRSQHTIPSLMGRDVLLFALALAGVALAVYRRVFAALPWVLWLGLALVALARHDPLWAHHNQLLVVPGAALAGIGLAGVVPLFPARERAPGAASVAIAFGVALAVSVGERWELLRTPYHRGDEREHAALAALRELGVRDGYVVTSRQIYAFYLGLPVPPLLSVTSAKRFRSGRLGAGTIVAEIRARRAELVILTDRWSQGVRDRVRRSIARDYELAYEDKANHRLEVYRRKR